MIRELEKRTYANRKEDLVIPTSKMKMYYHRVQFSNSKPHLSDFGYAAWQPAIPHTESVSSHLLLCQCSAESRATHHRECETRMKRSSWCKSRCPPGVEIPTPFQSGQRNCEVFNIFFARIFRVSCFHKKCRLFYASLLHLSGN